MEIFVQLYFSSLERVMHRDFVLKSNSIICLKNDEAILFYRGYLVFILQSILNNSNIYSAIPSPEEVRRHISIICVPEMEINIDMNSYKVLDLPEFFVKLQKLDKDLQSHSSSIFNNYFTIRNIIYIAYALLCASLVEI
jgi:hypothetical protein